jgi:hypothetical protein
MAVLNHLLVGDGDAVSWNSFGKKVVITKTINTAAVNVDSGDIVRLLDIPAKMNIERVVANVKTAEGGTLTIDVGDYLRADDNAVDADGFIDGANGNAVAAVSSSTETLTLTEGTPNTAAFSPAYARGKFYPAATAYLGVLFNNAADAAVIDVHVIGEICE